MNNLKFGVCAGSIEEAIRVAAENDLSVMQIFTADPYKFRTDLKETFENRIIRDARPDIDLVSHASLMTNLVSPKASTKTFSINSLIAEMKRCRVLGIKHIVAHPGSTEGPNGPTLLAESLKVLKSRVEGYGKDLIDFLCIENMVGSGNQIMSTPEDFAELFESLDIPNIRICLDTAHAWGAGYYPIDFIKRLKELNILEKLKVVHFNNTSSPLGSNKERHAELSEGVIPKEAISEFSQYLKTLPNIIVIEEQPAKADLHTTIKYLKEELR